MHLLAKCGEMPHAASIPHARPRPYNVSDRLGSRPRSPDTTVPRSCWALGQFYTSTIFEDRTRRTPALRPPYQLLCSDLPLIKAFRPEDVTSSQPVTFQRNIPSARSTAPRRRFQISAARRHVEAGEAGAALSERSYRGIFQQTSSWREHCCQTVAPEPQRPKGLVAHELAVRHVQNLQGSTAL